MSLARRCVVSGALLLFATSCTGDDDSVSSTSSIADAPATVAPVGVSTNSQPDTTTVAGIQHPAAARLDCAHPIEAEAALIGWGNTGNIQPTERFMVGPCATGAGWLVFPGGFWVSEPGCVSLLARHDGIEEYVTVAVGAPCSDPV